jgi:hypothetical protein
MRGGLRGLEVRDRLMRLALKAAWEKADASELTLESFADGYARRLTLGQIRNPSD